MLDEISSYDRMVHEIHSMATWVYDCSVNCLFGCDCTIFFPAYRDRSFPVVAAV